MRERIGDQIAWCVFAAYRRYEDPEEMGYVLAIDPNDVSADGEAGTAIEPLKLPSTR